MAMLRRALDAARGHFPATWERARRMAALPRGIAAWYAHRWRQGGGAAGEAYGAAFWEYHDQGDWDGFAALVLRCFPARAVFDVGCGDAKLLAAMQRVAPATRVLGIDGSEAALAVARTRGVPAQRLDLAAASAGAIGNLHAELRSFDLAVSLETVEHFPPWHAGKLLRLLAAAPVVVFSAAQPGQGGTLHVNERPVAYWVRRFRRLGYEPAPGNAEFRAELGRLELPWWYQANLNAFVRRAG